MDESEDSSGRDSRVVKSEHWDTSSFEAGDPPKLRPGNANISITQWSSHHRKQSLPFTVVFSSKNGYGFMLGRGFLVTDRAHFLIAGCWHNPQATIPYPHVFNFTAVYFPARIWLLVSSFLQANFSLKNNLHKLPDPPSTHWQVLELIKDPLRPQRHGILRDSMRSNASAPTNTSDLSIRFNVTATTPASYLTTAPGNYLAGSSPSRSQHVRWHEDPLAVVLRILGFGSFLWGWKLLRVN